MALTGEEPSRPPSIPLQPGPVDSCVRRGRHRLRPEHEPLSTLSDEQLIILVRTGNLTAYGELFSRHRASAANLARVLSRDTSSAEDLVAEAFVRILDTLLDGRGPDLAFRSYLITTVRHAAYDRTRKDKRLQFTDDETLVDSALTPDDPVLRDAERGFVGQAFDALPERSRSVLWHMVVEGQTASEVGAILGTSPSNVTTLAWRAKERLRQEYLQAHLAGNPAESCRDTVDRLGAWSRGGLVRREKAMVDRHLGECDSCSDLAAELTVMNTSLRALLGPLLLGGAAAGYLAGIGGAHVAAVGGHVSAGIVHALLRTGRTVVSTSTLGASTASAFIAAVVTTAITVSGMVGPGSSDAISDGVPAVSAVTVGQVSPAAFGAAAQRQTAAGRISSSALPVAPAGGLVICHSSSARVDAPVTIRVAPATEATPTDRSVPASTAPAAAAPTTAAEPPAATTDAPTTDAPTTAVATTPAATPTETPTTDGASTDTPATPPVTTEPVTTDAATTDVATTEATTTDVPTTDAATTDAPTTDAATTDAPTTGVPTTDPATTDARPTDPVPTDSSSSDPATTDVSTSDAGASQATTADPTAAVTLTTEDVSAGAATAGSGSVTSTATTDLTADGAATSPDTTDPVATPAAAGTDSAASDAPATDPSADPTTTDPTTTEAVATTADPTTADPATTDPATTDPSTADSTSAAVATTAVVSTADPTTSDPSTADPSTADPTTADPSTEALPTTASPTTADPTLDSASAAPTTAEPTTTAIATTAEPAVTAGDPALVAEESIDIAAGLSRSDLVVTGQTRAVLVPGASAVLQFSIVNPGQSSAPAAKIHLTLPAGVTVTGLPDQAACGAGPSGVVAVDLPSLSTGQRADFTVRLQAGPGASGGAAAVTLDRP